MMSDDRFEHKMALQARQIEHLLAHHGLEAEVARGEMRQHGPRQQTRFDVRTTLAAGLAQIKALTRDLQRAWHVAEIEVQTAASAKRLSIQQTETAAPVPLLDLLRHVDEMPPLTAVLGWGADERPVWLNLRDETAHHALIAGNAQAGKTMLLRSAALSLALHHKERDLQLVLIAGEPSPNGYGHAGLRPLGYLPHLLTPLVEEGARAAEVLRFLVDEATYRTQQGVQTPAIVVLIDEVAALVQREGVEVQRALTSLIRRGARSGIYLLLSTRQAEAPCLRDLHDAYLPARVVGQVDTAAQAQVAADALDSRAEWLNLRGDFLAVVGETMRHFQAAYIGDYDLHFCLEHLYAQRPPVLVAPVVEARPSLSAPLEPVSPLVYQPAARPLVLAQEDVVREGTKIEKGSPPAPNEACHEVKRPQKIARPITKPSPARIELVQAQPVEEEDAALEPIPFSWESPRFAPQTAMAQDHESDEIDVVSPISTNTAEVNPSTDEPEEAPPPPLTRRRFRAVHALLDKLEETLPEADIEGMGANTPSVNGTGDVQRREEAEAIIFEDFDDGWSYMEIEPEEEKDGDRDAVA